MLKGSNSASVSLVLHVAGMSETLAPSKIRYSEMKENFPNSKVAEQFNAYPDHVRPKMMQLRQLILDTAFESEIVNKLEETLSWGEPSYKTKTGSTIRMDWKQKQPDRFALYFTCTTSLVNTFKKLYGNKLKFEENRAIVFDLTDDIPELEVKHCISLALTYHKIKHLPMLGV